MAPAASNVNPRPNMSARAEPRDSGGMLKSAMKISLVVPAFNEERLLPGSLSCIRAAMQGFDRLGWKSELIVCDNNSTDRTAEIAIAAGGRGGFLPGNPKNRPPNPRAPPPPRGGVVFLC